LESHAFTKALHEYYNDGRDDEKSSKEVTDEQWFVIYFEILYLFLHLTDRYAFGKLEEPKRDKILSKIEDKSIDISLGTMNKNMPYDLRRQLTIECRTNFYYFVEEFSYYKRLIPDENESPKETVLWEFGKRISSLVSVEYDIAIITLCTDLAIEGWGNLKIHEFIDSIR
jgi:hypothetical protein